jgi:hypothetical protein
VIGYKWVRLTGNDQKEGGIILQRLQQKRMNQ